MMKKRNTKECCAPASFPTAGSNDEDLSNLSKALGHSARVKIIRHLAQEGVCISGDLAEVVDLAPSTVSEHLRILKEAGLVSGTIDGPKRCYCVNASALKYFESLLSNLNQEVKNGIPSSC
jgi:ArsR family transcriptional regulator